MPNEATAPTGFIGCDVGKAAIVIFDSRDGTTRTVTNRPNDLAAWAAALPATCLVVCEATGGYEDALLAALVEAGRPAHRADARKVKSFIRSFGILGKTDSIDARALARYGEERHAGLVRWQAPDPQRDRLQTLVRTRADLVADRGACANRLAAPGAEPVHPYLSALLACLETQIRDIDDAIDALIRNQDDLRRADATLQSIGGVGKKTAAALLGLMPELGRIPRRQAAALAGLAPHPDQSAKADRYRRTRGGRPEIKRVIFMAALAAARHDPILKASYKRLRDAGKKPIVAITAIMRRIIVIANAKLRDENAAHAATQTN